MNTEYSKYFMGDDENKGPLTIFLKAENRILAVKRTGWQTIKRTLQELPRCQKTWIQTVCTAKKTLHNNAHQTSTCNGSLYFLTWM
jgi:hypothetical protein